MSDAGDTRAVAERSLDAALEAVLGPWRSASGRLGILFSGGVDSGLLAWELRTRGGVTLYTTGLPESPDLRAARSAADEIGLPWKGLVLDPAEVDVLARRISVELDGASSIERSVQISLGLALAHAPPVPLLCGQGVDEMFGGYAHFRGLSPPDAARRSESDLRRLVDREWPRTLAIARRVGRTLEAPYLDERFRDAVRRIEPALRLGDDPPKALFRGWARHRGVPEAVAALPKRAFQYGSGIDRLLRRGGS